MNEMTPPLVWTVVIGMAVLNFAFRFAPLALFSRIEMPAPVLRWLSFIPIAVMGSLVASEVLRPGGTWQPPLTNPGVYAALLTMVIFRFTRSFLGATVAGMLSYVALRAILG